MSVGSFDPQAVVVTASARAHIATQIARSGHAGLRLGVKESGCNGYMYTLDYIDEPLEDDEQIEVGGTLKLYVRRGDLPLVQGTEVDFILEGLNASLKFKNPNAESHCGCGESFAVQAATG